MFMCGGVCWEFVVAIGEFYYLYFKVGMWCEGRFSGRGCAKDT